MEIRILGQQELMPSLGLVWDVFAEDVAPSYTQEGVAQFQEFIKYEHMDRMYRNREVIFWGAYEEQELLGVIAMMQNGHICLFFVKKEWQGKGVGRMLYQTAYNYCAQELRLGRITVNSAPDAVAKYRHLGMTAIDSEQEMNGIRFVPMEAIVTMGMIQPTGGKKSPALIIAIAAGVLLALALIIGMVLLGTFVYRTIRQPETKYYREVPDDYFDYYDDFGEYGYDDGFPDDDTDAQNSGLDMVEEYYAENLPYEIEEETYQFTDEEKQSTFIAFQVKYPQLKGSSGNDYEAANEAIKQCAMATVDEIYTNPSEEVKETVLGAKTPALISVVNYKACYASDNFVSIAFEDAHAKGDYDLYDGDLRTINIGLKDGKVYTVKDIVKLDNAFMDEWLEKMREEAQNDAFLSELGEDDMKNALAGDSMDGVYTANYFVCADGIEIGFDLNYPADDTHDLGYIWVTAPFDFDEIRPHIADEDFWNCLNR